MTDRRARNLYLLSTALLLLTVMPSAAAIAEDVRIELRPRAAVTADEILLRDIARITGASPAGRRDLEQLDVSLFEHGEDETIIRGTLVQIRLRLDGWSADEFQLSGAEEVRVRRVVPAPITDTNIEQAALATMQELLGVDEKELQVRLTGAFMSSQPSAVQEDPELRLEVLPPTKSRTGTVSLLVRLWRDQRLVSSRPARFEVLRRQHVAVARVSLQRNHVITENDVQFENRFLATPVDQLDQSQLIGQHVRSTVSVGKLLSVRDLKQQRTAHPEQVIKSRERIRVVAVSGRLKVELHDAEALQSGAVGDVIRFRNLRNPDTRRILSGRITEPGQVEIRL